MRNTCFCFPNPEIGASRFYQKLMFFRVSFLDTLFSLFLEYDHPFRTQLGPKWRPKSTKQPKGQNCLFGPLVTLFWGPGTDPFPETIPIDLFVKVKRFVIDLWWIWDRFCWRLVGVVDGCVIVFVTLLVNILVRSVLSHNIRYFANYASFSNMYFKVNGKPC